MTPQEQLHAVSTAIRKALPRLLEPTEGCWFHNEITLKKEKLILIDVNQNYVLLKQGGKNFSVFTKEKTKKLLKIIGHDILLSDVLEWLAREHNNIEIFLMNNGIILINFREDKPNRVVIDFSKPRLADQSEELWEFLYNLIKDN